MKLVNRSAHCSLLIEHVVIIETYNSVSEKLKESTNSATFCHCVVTARSNYISFSLSDFCLQIVTQVITAANKMCELAKTTALILQPFIAELCKTANAVIKFGGAYKSGRSVFRGYIQQKYRNCVTCVNVILLPIIALNTNEFDTLCI